MSKQNFILSSIQGIVIRKKGGITQPSESQPMSSTEPDKVTPKEAQGDAHG